VAELFRMPCLIVFKTILFQIGTIVLNFFSGGLNQGKVTSLCMPLSGNL
jgi:hypothetical protein